MPSRTLWWKVPAPRLVTYLFRSHPPQPAADVIIEAMPRSRCAHCFGHGSIRNVFDTDNPVRTPGIHVMVCLQCMEPEAECRCAPPPELLLIGALGAMSERVPLAMRRFLREHDCDRRPTHAD